MAPLPAQNAMLRDIHVFLLLMEDGIVGSMAMIVWYVSLDCTV